MSKLDKILNSFFYSQIFDRDPEEDSMNEAKQQIRELVDEIIGSEINKDDGSSAAFLNGREYQRFCSSQRAKELS